MPDTICDFCSSPDVRWAYPARNFTKTVPGANVDYGSFGGWAACPVCHGLIERGDRTRLARRSAKRLSASQGGTMPWGLLLPAIRGLHDKFWSNREGPPVPTTPGAPDPTTRLES